MNTVRLRLLLLPVLSLSGCFYPSDRGRALEAKVDKLNAENEQLSAQMRDAQEKLIPKIDTKIAEVTRVMESLDKATRRTGADTGVQLEKTIQDVAALRGQVETYVFKLNDLEAALKKMGEDTEKLKGAEAVAKKRAEESTCPPDKSDCIKLAAEKAAAGDGAVARALYVQFLKKWGKDKDDSVAEAHLGLGETFFSDAKCREALYEYGKVIEDFPKSKSAPKAYLRSSDCFSKLNMNEEARIALEEVVKGFPKNEAAKTAKAKLAELDKAKKATPKKPKK
ncbi:MAG: tetratricopeptide repeat protein [Myxococcaceae bacterium]